MKKITSMLKLVVMVITLLTLSLMLTGFSPNPQGETVRESSEVSAAMSKAISSLDLQEGELTVVSQMKGAKGNTILICEDNNYSYYVNESTNEVVVVSMNTRMMEKKVASAPEVSSLSTKQSDAIIQEVITKYFPEYDPKNLVVDVDSESGSPIEYYRYSVSEIQDDIQINRALISLSYDGQLTLLYGSHNSIDSSKNYSAISQDDAKSVAFEYMMNQKETLEKNVDFSNTVEEEIIVATEDMILPDGVSVGDEFVLERLPNFQIKLNSIEDMDFIQVKKVVYNDTVAWFLEFIVDTSWGEYDTIFNPLVHVYIDASTGKVLEMNTTDGD